LIPISPLFFCLKKITYFHFNPKFALQPKIDIGLLKLINVTQATVVSFECNRIRKNTSFDNESLIDPNINYFKEINGNF